jgi:hypothetical protein
MSRGKHLSLEEARKSGKLDRFAKELPAGDQIGVAGRRIAAGVGQMTLRVINVS